VVVSQSIKVENRSKMHANPRGKFSRRRNGSSEEKAGGVLLRTPEKCWRSTRGKSGALWRCPGGHADMFGAVQGLSIQDGL
jgi:hypothetical protein